MEKALLLYRNINGTNIPFPSAKNIFSDTSYTKENPFIIDNPNQNGEKYIETDIYCDLLGGKEYRMSMRFDTNFSTNRYDGIDIYMLKDKKYKTFFSILGYRVDFPDIELKKIITNDSIEVIIRPSESGRYYLRLDNNKAGTIANVWDIFIGENVFYEQISLTNFTFNAQRMAATPTITASFNYPRCLDNEWDVNVFAEYKGEKYYIRQIPSSSKDNKSVMYKHDITLYSERFVLENIYLYDVLKNDDTNVIIRCDLKDFTDVINRSLEKSNLPYRISIDDSVANTEKALEVKDIALDKVYLSVALQEIYNQWEIPFYFEGHNIIVKDHSKWIADTVLEYGYDKSLLSIKKDNANFRKITRCSGYGSDKNIPFFYPNLSQKGVIDLEPLESNKLLQKSDFVITDMRKFDKQMPLNGSVIYQLQNNSYPTFISGNYKDIPNVELSLENKNPDNYTLSFSFSSSPSKSDLVNFYFNIKINESFYCGKKRYYGNFWKTSRYGDITWSLSKDDALPKELMSIFNIEENVSSSGGSEKQSSSVIEELSTVITKEEYEDGNLLKYNITREFAVSVSCYTSNNDLFVDNNNIYNAYINLSIKKSEAVEKGSIIGTCEVFTSYSLFHSEEIIAENQNHKALLEIEDIRPSYFSDSDLGKGWYINGNKKIELSDIGVKYLKTENDTISGDGFKQIMVIKIPTATNLMPPLYRNTFGNEKFYNAKDNTYLNDNNEYYDFETEWNDVNQSEHIQPFEDIYPTIKNIVNAENIPFDEILDVAFDDNDNNEVDEEGNFLHPYFYVKIAQFNGSNGFNLFDHKIVGGNMQVSFTSGDCSACLFDIMVKTRPNANNETYEDVVNPIKTENNTLASGDWQQKTAGNFGSEDTTQQNSETNSIWLVLKKDDQTFGTTLPDSIGGVFPKKGDKFVLLNIEMPQKYIDSAEELLRKNIIQYMWENNSDKWNFTIDFSRIFLQENPIFVDDLSENAKVRVKYNDVIYDFYVNNFSYEVKANEVLPKIKIGLADTLSVNKSITQTIASGILKDVQGQLSHVSILGDLNAQYLRKRYDETMPNNMTFEKKVTIKDELLSSKIKSNNIQSNNYSDSSNNDVGYKLVIDENGESLLVVDKAKIRKRIDAYEYVINQIKAQGGTLLITSASIECNRVENNNMFYRCYFDNKNGSIYNQFEVNDLAKCQRFGNSPKYYWRKVIGVGQDYIDLSVDDCEQGSDIPNSEDIIIQLGNTNNKDRQSAIEISSNGESAPSFIMFSGINTYSLLDKQTTGIVYHQGVTDNLGNLIDAYPEFFSYGSMYFGSRDKQSNFISYERNADGEFEMIINAKTTFKSGTQNISDILASIDNSANDAKNTANTANNTATTAKSTADKANVNSQNAQNIANQAQTDVGVLGVSVKPITDAIKGSTEIEGGLVNTNVLMVKDSNNAISGGISGVSSDNIAFWSGGTLTDAINGNCNVIIRKDGTAKIGSFIVKDGYVEVKLDSGGYARMNTDGIRIFDNNNIVRTKLIGGNVSNSLFESKLKAQLIQQGPISETFTFTKSSENSSSPGVLSMPLLNVIKNTNKLNVSIGVAFNLSSSYYNPNFKNEASLYESVELTKDGESYKSLSGGTFTYQDGNFYDNNGDKIQYITIKKELEYQDLPLGNYGIDFKIGEVSSANFPAPIGFQFSSTVSARTSASHGIIANLMIEDPSTIIGVNGVMTFQRTNQYFGAYTDPADNQFKIIGKGDVVNIEQN